MKLPTFEVVRLQSFVLVWTRLDEKSEKVVHVVAHYYEPALSLRVQTRFRLQSQKTCPNFDCAIDTPERRMSNLNNNDIEEFITLINLQH